MSIPRTPTEAWSRIVRASKAKRHHSDALRRCVAQETELGTVYACSFTCKGTVRTVIGLAGLSCSDWSFELVGKEIEESDIHDFAVACESIVRTHELFLKEEVKY